VPSDLKRYYGAGDLHFITFSCYRRLPFFSSARRKDIFLRSLEKARCTYHFVVLGYVVMPEHVHLLVTEPRKSDLSTAIKALKQSVSRSVLCSSRKKRTDQLRLFHSERPQRFWQPRFYDFNVFTEKKRLEKLRYIHRNPVTRGLVSKPEDWRWSSYRSYAFAEAGLVAINTIPELKMMARAAAQ
jgi:putative transposase